MFERYTEKARRTIFYARFEASQFASPKIEPEHLLLGLLREDKVRLHLYLPSFDSAEAISAQIEARTPPAAEKASSSVDLPLSNPSKRVLAYAAEEANRLGHKHIGPEHLFLGLLREEEGFAVQILRQRGADLNRVRKELAATPLQPPTPREEAEAKAAFASLISPMEGPRPHEKPRPASPAGFERYTEKARRAIFFARYYASQFGSPYIETEHLLLGLMREGREHLGLFFPSVANPDSIRAQVEAHTVKRPKISTSVDLPLSNECRRVLAFSSEEAERLRKPHIGTEHVFLGLLREQTCFAALLLRENGADLDRIRQQLAAPPIAPPPEPGQPK